MAWIHDPDIRAHVWHEFHVRENILTHIETRSHFGQFDASFGEAEDGSFRDVQNFLSFSARFITAKGDLLHALNELPHSAPHGGEPAADRDVPGHG